MGHYIWIITTLSSFSFQRFRTRNTFKNHIVCVQLFFSCKMQDCVPAVASAEVRKNGFQIGICLPIKKRKPAADSSQLIWNKVFIDLNTLCEKAPSTWNLICLISSILHFTPTQLINKMLVLLVSRLNVSTVMNIKALVLGSMPWCLAKMHLDSDK